MLFQRFLADRRGNVAMMFGLLAVPLIAATGAAVDFSRAYEQRMVVQDALDAAALAANRLIGLATDEEILAEAQAFFDANIAEKLDIEIDFTMELDGGTVTLDADLAVPTAFLGIIGIDDINFDVLSKTMSGAATFEVVLVLDNSGSMSGTKITTLKTAALALINSLFALSVSNPQPDPVKVGIVPFAASVNVGPSFATESWMDGGTGGTALSPNSALNFQADTTLGNTTAYTNTFAVFDAMTNVDWRGCVEARAYPYAVDDTAPATATPATLFTPMFAPDEPNGVTTNYPNSYLNDTGGNCTTPTTTTTGTDPCAGYTGFWLSICRYFNGYGPWTTTTAITLTDEQRQERTCKYQGVTLSSQYTGAGQGPNLNCTTNAITDLSTSQTALTTAINAMAAGGYTNIHEGVMWGWRVLSPTLPFTQGRAYGTTGNRKIMIVMTDGANTYDTYTNINNSFYSAFNYMKYTYLGVATQNETTVVDAMNDRTLEACENIHEDTEITIYTIAFEMPADAQDAVEVLQDCASDPAKAFQAANSAELIAVFQLIAQDIATLRIAQ